MSVTCSFSGRLMFLLSGKVCVLLYSTLTLVLLLNLYKTYPVSQVQLLSDRTGVDVPPVHRTIFVMEQIEQWKDVVGFEDYYQISSLGNIRTKPRTFKGPWGADRTKGIRCLKPQKLRDGYLRIGLKLPKSKQQMILIHRLVATAFIDNPDNKEMVNHKNGLKGDNRVENLEWVTRVENVRHSFDNGLQINPKGQDHRMAKLTEEDVLAIRYIRQHDKWLTKELAKEFGVSNTNIKDIINRKIWTHI